MAIIRAARQDDDGFYVLRRSIREDRRLSWAARGLLIFLLGKPDHWKVSVANLVRETVDSDKPSGRDAVYSLLRELEVAGYITRHQARSESGQMGEMDYHVGEIGSPLTANPHTVEPLTAKPTQVINEGSVSNETTVTTKDPDGFADFWSVYPRREARVDAVKAYRQAKITPTVFEAIKTDIRRRVYAKEWRLNEKQYIPLPASYLRARRWEDETASAEDDRFAGGF